MNTTPTLVDTTVAAKDAPLGVLLWPVLDERYAPNYTLESVDIVRNAAGIHVRWVYQNGKTRRFQPDDQVAVRVVAADWPDVHSALTIPTQVTASHHADRVASRPTSVVKYAKLTDTQAAYLKWYATRDIRHADGFKGNSATSTRLEQLRLAEHIDQWPYRRPTDRGNQWLIAHGFGHLVRGSAIE